MEPTHLPPTAEKALIVRRGRVEAVDLYEIKDSELDALELGSPASLQLNFAIFLISTAITAVVSLATSTFSSATIRTVFIVVAVLGVLGGAYLTLMWWRTRKSVIALCSRIRGRIPKDLAQGEVDPSGSSGPSTGPTAPQG